MHRARNGLVQHLLVRGPNRFALPAIGLDPLGLGRLERKIALDFRTLRLIELSIDVALDQLFGDRRRAHLITLSVAALPFSSSSVRNRSRPRARRDITVPSGAPITCAAAS